MMKDRVENKPPRTKALAPLAGVESGTCGGKLAREQAHCVRPPTRERVLAVKAAEVVCYTRSL